MSRRGPALVAFLMYALSMAGCRGDHPPLALADDVDLERFMGDWYVIASIPTSLERDAYNAVESYRLDEKGTVETTFTFRKGGFDGEIKRYTPRGFVQPGTGNAVWGMQFVWPIKADYRIAWLAPDYSRVVVGREDRDYVWIMAREPSIPEAELERILAFVGQQGYDVSQVRKVPQRWDGAGGGAA
jgi:apolipoprotein D and lipocalin family protein